MLMNRRLAIGLVTIGLVAASCGSDGTTSGETNGGQATSGETTIDASIRTVSAADAAAVLTDAPDDLVVLDIRTPQEYAEGHLDGAVLIDFYEADFAEQLSALDPDVPYLVYCRSGNRSGQAMRLFEELGFRSATNVDGGIVALASAGVPLTAE